MLFLISSRKRDLLSIYDSSGQKHLLESWTASHMIQPLPQSSTYKQGVQEYYIFPGEGKCNLSNVKQHIIICKTFNLRVTPFASTYLHTTMRLLSLEAGEVGHSGVDFVSSGASCALPPPLLALLLPPPAAGSPPLRDGVDGPPPSPESVGLGARRLASTGLSTVALALSSQSTQGREVERSPSGDVVFEQSPAW